MRFDPGLSSFRSNDRAQSRSQRSAGPECPFRLAELSTSPAPCAMPWRTVTGCQVTLVGRAQRSDATAADGSYSSSRCAGQISPSPHGATTALVPPAETWFIAVQAPALESDRSLDLKLPPTHSDGRSAGHRSSPVPEAAVKRPPMFTGKPTSGAPSQTSRGRPEVLAICRAPMKTAAPPSPSSAAPRASVGDHPEVIPPVDSGYGVTGSNRRRRRDTTVVVHPPALVHLTGALRDAPGEPVIGRSDARRQAPRATRNRGRRLLFLRGPPGKYSLYVAGDPGFIPAEGLFIAVRLPPSIRSPRLKLPPTSLTVEVLGTELAVRRSRGQVPPSSWKPILVVPSLAVVASRPNHGDLVRTPMKTAAPHSPSSAAPRASVGHARSDSARRQWLWSYRVRTAGDRSRHDGGGASAGPLHLTGALRNAAGEPVQGAEVTLANGVGAPISTHTAADGSYSLAGRAGQIFPLPRG